MKSRRGQGPTSRFSGQTPLDRAISHRNVEMAQFLLSLEQPVHCCYHKEGSPGHTWLLSVQEKMHEQRNTVIPASSWSIEEVCAWVNRIGYPQYSDIFEKEMIDGSVLFMIEPNDFSESLGIDAETGKVFMSEIQKLREEPFAQRQKARQQELETMKGKKKRPEPAKVEEQRSIEELVQLINGSGASTKTNTNKKKKNKKNKTQPTDEEGSVENSPTQESKILTMVEEPKNIVNSEKEPDSDPKQPKKEPQCIDDQTYIQDLEFMRSHCGLLEGTNHFEEESFDPEFIREVDLEVEEWRLRLQNASLENDDFGCDLKSPHRPLIVGQRDPL